MVTLPQANLGQLPRRSEKKVPFQKLGSRMDAPSIQQKSTFKVEIQMADTNHQQPNIEFQSAEIEFPSAKIEFQSAKNEFQNARNEFQSARNEFQSARNEFQSARPRIDPGHSGPLTRVRPGSMAGY